jgi:YidC/Oxa1 family membrane protein insertase
MNNEDTRNTVIFGVCAIVIFILYQTFVLGPAAKQRQAELARQQPAAAAGQLHSAPVIRTPPTVSRAVAIAASPRVRVVTPALTGSVSLKGARIDDLYLNQYRQTVDKSSPPVELFRPEGAGHAWFAEFTWIGANVPGLPTADTVWTQTEGSTLAPGRPIVLAFSNGQGLAFTRKISVDDRFMFTIVDTVANNGPTTITLAPFSSVQRQGLPDDLGRNTIVHEGAVGWLGDRLRLTKYRKWMKETEPEAFSSKGGWAGVTDKYWLAALIPSQTEQVQAQFRMTQAGTLEVFEANYVGQQRTIPAGGQVSETARLFAGAKTVPVLKDYQDKLGVPRFDSAVDWGNFWFLTRPIFIFLEFIYRQFGNFGVAILVLTVTVRGLFFPLANKQYESLTMMKKVQPQMDELRAKYKDDPAKQQQELMALYQREKINPLAGCLPILFQIPVFYALYKVLTVTIEMRHAPFLGWIQDLSARDPTTVWNLFGLIPWDPATAPVIGSLLGTSLHLGVLPVLYGVTMWLTTAMSPPAGDPVQQKIFQFMPLIFTFIMAPFAIGLLIYWTWSNVLTILQQYVIMRRFKVDNPIDRILRRFTGKPEAA